MSSDSAGCQAQGTSGRDGEFQNHTITGSLENPFEIPCQSFNSFSKSFLMQNMLICCWSAQQRNLLETGASLAWRLSAGLVGMGRRENNGPFSLQ